MTARFGLGAGPEFWLKTAGAFVVSALLIAGLVWFGEPAEIWAVLTSAAAGPLAAAVGLYGVVLTARWVRLIGLVDPDEGGVRRLDLLWASAGHSFANQILPARTGELVFPELWRRATGEEYADGAVYLAAIRVVELGIVVAIFGVGLVVWLSGRAQTGVRPWLVAALIGGGLALLLVLPVLLRIGLRIADWLVRRTRLAEIDLLEPLREAVPQARRAVENLGRTKRLWLVATSSVMWVAMFGVFYFTVAACGADLGIAQTVVGSAGGIVGNLLPIGGIGSLGTMEAGWTAAFRATGAPAGPVVASGLLVHGIVIAGTGLATAAAVAGSAMRGESGPDPS